MADPRNLLNAYQQQLARRGLGSVFQLEGPEQVSGGISMMSAQEALDAGVSPAFLRELGTHKQTQQLMDTRPRQVGSGRQGAADIKTILSELATQGQRAQGIGSGKSPIEADIFSEDTLDLIRSFAPETSPMGNLLKKAAMKKDAEGVASKLAARPEGMTTLESLEADMADAAAAKEELAPKPKSLSAEGFRAEEQKRAEMAGMDTKGTMIDNAFMAAMKEYNKASGKEEDTADLSDADLMEKYKKEFADATGIDVSGKVDKSQALMAFGLALMQNRAGKGFNVGRLLSAVGKAGEAAMPKLEAAQQEAKAAKLAAGKYALEQIKAGKSAEAAFAKEMRERAFEWALEERKLQAEAEKAASEGIEYKNVADREILPEVKVAYGIDRGNTVLAKPSADATTLANSWNKYTRGEEVTNQMMGLLEDFSSSSAPTIEILADRAKSVLSSLGIGRPSLSLGPEGATKEQKFNALKLSVINEMKKIILQESQVSDFDRKTLEASFGVLEAFKNPEEAQFALQEMINFFASRKAALSGVLQQMYDPSYYRSTKEYERTTSFLNENMAVPYIKAPEPNGPNGSSAAPIATVDLNKRGS